LSSSLSTTWHHSICQTIASSLPPPVVVIIFGRRTVSSLSLGDRSCIFCFRTKNLEQSAYTSPSAWFITWQFVPDAVVVRGTSA